MVTSFPCGASAVLRGGGIPMTKRAVFLAGLMIAFPTVAAPPTPPAAPPVQPVTEDYFGTKVTDNYRYMEDPKNQVANDWIRAEGHYTRALLDSIPGRAAVAKQIAGASGSFGFINTFQSYGGRDFWLERVPGSDNYDLMVRDSAGKRKLVDLEALRAKNGGKSYAVNYYAASPDGSKVAVGISEGGSELALMTVLDAKTGATIAGPVERMQFGPPSWSDDGKLILSNQLAQMKPGQPDSERYLNTAAVVWDMKNPPL